MQLKRFDEGTRQSNLNGNLKLWILSWVNELMTLDVGAPETQIFRQLWKLWNGRYQTHVPASFFLVPFFHL